MTDPSQPLHEVPGTIALHAPACGLTLWLNGPSSRVDRCMNRSILLDDLSQQHDKAPKHAGTDGCEPYPAADGSAGSAPITGSKRRAASAAEGDEKKQRKGLYFEFAKKKWENEDSFKLPDGAQAGAFHAAES